jgi:uncharacterized Zn finger protein
MSWHGGWAPYVSVAERRRKAAKKVALMKKKGKVITPIEIESRAIAHSFWGKAWCENLESYSDYENRLPRGRTYVRNGSVVHLEIKKGSVDAFVSGSELYTVKIDITAVNPAQWKGIIKECSGKINSLVELLGGKFSNSVMEIMTKRKTGLFPKSGQITLNCSCPDSAEMCKHVAATLYGVGAKLDEKPELLFLLRKVDHLDLISNVTKGKVLDTKAKDGRKKIKTKDLSSLFGVDIVDKKPSAKTKKKATKKANLKKRATPVKPLKKSKVKTIRKKLAHK